METAAVARRRALGLLGAVAVFIVASLAVTCPSAEALVQGPLTTAEAQHLDQLTQWLYRNGATTSAPSCGTVCSELLAEQHSAAPAEAAGAAEPSELFGVLEESVGEGGTGLLPTIGDVIPTIALGTAAFTIGWKIGGLIDKWIGIDVPKQPSGVATVGLRFAPRGDTFPFPTYHETVSMPYDGYYAATNGRAGVVASSTTVASDCNEGDPGQVPGFVEVSWWWNDCFIWYGEPTAPITAHAYLLDPIPAFGRGIQDYAGQPVDVTSNPVDDPGQTTVQDHLKARLEAGEAPALRDWIDRELARFATMPDCRGLTQSACGTELDGVGLTVGATQVLSFDDADPTLPADAVVRSDPAPGSDVLKTHPVTLYVNPAEADMPRIVPAPEPDETAAHYIERVHALNLLAAPVYSPTVDPGKTEDQTTGTTSPSVGTRVHQGTGVYVDAVNEPVLDDTPGDDPAEAPAVAAADDRQDCDLSQPALGYLGDPTAHPKYDPFNGDIFEGISPTPPAPTFQAPAETGGTATLRWGYTFPPPNSGGTYDWGGWGYRHIAAKHGWAVADAEAAQGTLLSGNWFETSEGRHEYRGPRYTGRNGATCERVVVIEPNQLSGETYLGEPAPPPGIWTSFGQLAVFPLE